MVYTTNVLNESFAERAEQADADITQVRELSCLILDDDLIDAEYLVYQLNRIETVRANTAIATSVEQAKQLLDQYNFDLFLIDFWLSSQTSIAFINELATSLNNNAIIVLSSLEGDRIREIGLRAGAVQFLSKCDVTPDSLAQCIKTTGALDDDAGKRQRLAKKPSAKNVKPRETFRAVHADRPSDRKELPRKPNQWGMFAKLGSLLREEHTPHLPTESELTDKTQKRCELSSELRKFVNNKLESSCRIQVIGNFPTCELSVHAQDMQNIFGFIVGVLQEGISSVQSVNLSAEKNAGQAEIVFAVEKFTNFHNAKLALLKTQKMQCIESLFDDQQNEELNRFKHALGSVGGAIAFSSDSRTFKVKVRISLDKGSQLRN